VLLDYDQKTSLRFADTIQDVDIIADIEMRFGTAEVTRRGMKEREMETIAQLLRDALKSRKSKDEIKNRVHKLVGEFTTLEYSLS
jgi:glycine hydroxymethyltransferase